MNYLGLDYGDELSYCFFANDCERYGRHQMEEEFVFKMSSGGGHLLLPYEGHSTSHIFDNPALPFYISAMLAVAYKMLIPPHATHLCGGFAPNTKGPSLDSAPETSSGAE